jgi:hypothetical protein
MAKRQQKLWQCVLHLDRSLNQPQTKFQVDALEPFHPDRIVSRLLGMGDVLSLIEEIGQKVDAHRR